MKTATFDPSAFVRLKAVEQNHFWFHVRRKWIFERIRKFVPPPATLLEVGCGTGNVSSFLSRKGYRVTGSEYFSEALDMAWPGFEKVRADAGNLPFENNAFDVVGLFDVIEHFDNDAVPLAEAKRVVKKGGIVAVTVPAGKELWSYVDERALHKRRYEPEELRKVLSGAGLTPLLVQYMFMTLYWPMKTSRGKGKRKDDNQFLINHMVNLFLKGLFHGERIVSGICPLPMGTSLIAVARKDR